MKVFSVPEAVPFPTADFANYDFKAEQAREEAHKQALRQHLRDMGYTGKHNGKIARFPIADGYAQYMLADGNGRYGSSFLIHLPYCDAWHYHDIGYLPKKAIVERIEQQDRADALFAKKAVA